MQQYYKTIQKMINFDDVTKENIKQHNPNWPQIYDHPYWILLIGSSGSGETNSVFILFTLIYQQLKIDKIYLYTKDSYEAKYLFLINKRESIGLKYINDFKALIDYLNVDAIWMLFIKTLKNTTQIGNVKYQSLLIISLLISLLIKNLI